MDGAAVVSDTICDGDNPTFTVAGGTGQSFQWRVDGFVQSTTNTPTFNASDVGYTLVGVEVIDVVVYDRPLLGGVIDPAACQSTTNSITLTVLTPTAVTLVSDAINETFCSGDNVVFTVTNPIVGVTNYRFLQNGINTIQNGPSNTTSISTLADGDQITVVLTLVSGCTATASLTMIENPITAGTISGTQNICSGDTPAQITNLTSPTIAATATPTYQWHSSIDNFVTFNVINLNSPNYQPPALTQTTQFRRVDIANLNGQTCSTTTGPITVVVDPEPVGNLLINGTGVSSVTICSSDAPIFTISGSAPNDSYRFIIDGSIQATTNTPTFDPVALGYTFVGTHVVEAVIYNSPLIGGNPDPNACIGNTSSITVNVAVGPAVSLTVTGSINNTFCTGDTLLYTATAIPSATYNFRVNTITRQNTSSNTFEISTLSDGDAVDVLITLNSGCTVTTTTITMIENAIVTAGTISPVTQNICYNSTPTLLINTASATLSSGTASLRYVWQSSTDNTNFFDIGATSLSYQPPRLLQTTYFKRLVYSELNNKECFDESNTLVVNVAPQLFGGNILPAGGQDLCFSLLVAPATLTVTNSVAAPLVDYQWQDSNDGLTWTDIGGANGTSFTPPTLTSTATIYYRRITRALGGGPGCVEVSDVHIVTVNDIDPGTIDTAANNTYCYGTDIPLIASTVDASSSLGLVTYQWQSRTLSSIYQDIPGAINNAYDPGVLTETTLFRRTVSAVTSTTTCTAESNEIRVDIISLIDPGTISSDQTVCENIIPANLTLNGAPAGGGISYQWENSTNGFSWSTMPGEVNLTLPLTSPATQTTFYRVRVANNPGGLTIPVPNQSQITLTKNLNPLAVGETYIIYINTSTYSFTTTALTSDTNSIGSNLATQIDGTGGLSAVYDSSTNIISIQPLQTNISIATNPAGTAHDLVYIQSVTGDGCIAYTDPVEITVNPAPTLTLFPGRPDQVGTQDVCPGDAIIDFRYEWGNGATELVIEGLNAAYTATPGIGGAVNPIIGQPNWYRVTGTDEVTISGTAGPSNYFRVRTDGSGCTEAQDDYFIEVQPVAIQPDVIMKDFNSVDYAIINDGTNWYNNTVCQDRSDIGGGGPTPPTEFYTCFIDNGFNLLYNEFDWKVEPPAAISSLVEEERQIAEITISSANATITAGAIYTVTVNGISYSVTSTVAGAVPEIDDIDELGQQLAIAITANPNVTANYIGINDQLRVSAISTNTIFTISRTNPTSAGDNATMTLPNIATATAKATVNWNEFFTGTASVSVRTAGCGPASTWFTVAIEILPETIPATTASDLSPPIDLSAIDPTLGATLCGGSFTGVTPDCQITATTPDTQYFASSIGGTNDYAALSWSITATSIGNPAVPTPGTIDPSTGVVNWNTGFYGSFDIGVAPLDCDGNLGTRTTSSYSIGASETDRPDIFATNEPDCPIPAGGFQTSLNVPDYPVRWFVNNLGALQTGGGVNQNTVISAVRREIASDAGSNDQNLTLYWTPGFSGTLFVTVTPRDCPGTSRTYRINVPAAPDIRYDSGGTTNQQLCIGDPLDPIVYRLEGSATGIVSGSLGLPPNILPSVNPINQIQRITLTATTSPVVSGRIYTVSIDNTDYDYSVQVGDVLNDIGVGLQAAIPAAVMSVTYDVGTQTLILEGNIAGRDYDVVPNAPANFPGVNLGWPTNNGSLFFVTLSGNIIGATPGVYTYTVTTTSGSGSCTLQDSINGRITVNENSNITLISGSLTENVCDGTPITPIQFRIDNANSYDEAGLDASLPAGLDSSIAGNIVTIIGTPVINPPNPTPYSYTVTSVNNLSGCAETTLQAQITVLPAPIINPEPGAVLSQNVCAFETIAPIEFTVSNPAFGLTFVPGGTNLPAGVSGTLLTRQQVTEIDFGGAAGVAGSITISINNGIPFTFNATNISTPDNAGNQLALDINSDPRFIASYNTPTLTVTHTNSGVSFSTEVDNGTSNITLSTPDVVTTPAIFVISGTPSVTLVTPFTYTYELQATGPSCTGTTSNVSGTLTVNPATSGSLAAGSGSEVQTICDNTAVDPIIYDLVGVGSIAADAGNPTWLNAAFDLAGQQLTISGTPNISNLTQQSFEYSYTLVGNFFGCAASTSTLSGIITIDPTDQLTLISGSDNQTVCIDDNIVDIIYEFAGSANAVAFTSPIGLPPGVFGNYVPRNQVSQIDLTTGTTVVTETYTVFVNSTPYTIIAPPGLDQTNIGPLLATQIGGDPDVSAVYDAIANAIVITSSTAGNSFGIYIPSNTNIITLQNPVLITSPGTFIISGTPSGAASGTYNYALSTPGATCAADTAIGTIVVNQKSSLMLTTSNDGQIVCDASLGSFNDMVYAVGGNAGGVIANGLPRGITLSLDNPLNPTIATISGDPITDDTGVNTYNFTLTTTANANGCEETFVNGTIVIRPVDSLTLSSTLASTNQDVCVGIPITPIVYEFAGGALGASVVGLPQGLNDDFDPRNQVSSIRITGPNVNANEVYDIIVNNVTHTVTSTAGQTPLQVAQALRAVINTDSSVVSATLNGSILVLTAVIPGQAFSVRTDRSSLAQLTLDNPVLENGTGVLTITGTPTTDAILGGTSTSYTITITTVNATGCDTAIETPLINVNTNSTVSVTTASTTINQELCVGDFIVPIEFNIGGGATFIVDSGLPPNVNIVPTGINTFRVQGRPLVSITSPTLYSFTVTTTGNANGCIEDSFSGSFTIYPDDGIALDPGSGPDNQTVCEGSDPILSSIATITYTLSGGAVTASVTGLPAGLMTSYDSATRAFSIFGIPSVTVTNSTNYNYTVTTTGTCVNATAGGIITVEPKAKLVLKTATSTLNQTVCDLDAIADIEFDLVGGSVNARASGLPPGVSLGPVVANGVTISGIPTLNTSTPTIFTFTVTATGNGSGCEEEVFTGQIQVLPNNLISLVTASNTTDQTLCVSNDPALSALTTITYQLSGGSTSANFIGLPPGFNPTFDALKMQYNITGMAVTDVPSTTIYNYTVTTSGNCTPRTEIGRITIIPKAKIDVTSASPTLDQTVCDGTSITDITFDISGSATNASANGLPSGVSLGPIVGNTITISGRPVVNISSPTLYTYTVTATGNGTCEEESFTGEIMVLPNDQLTHLSGAKNQSICDGNDPANLALTPIVFQVGGGAVAAVVTGLPSGMSFTYSNTTKQVIIDGRPSSAVTVTTDFNYTVRTIGTCSDTTDTGRITVDPLPSLILSSNVSTTSQVGANAVCMGADITEIFYQMGGSASFFTATGLPNGVQAQATGVPGQIRIYGQPNTGALITEVFVYTISTTGPCEPQASLSGTIQVDPSPIIDANFILNNDVTHVTCNGGNDGSIVIPPTSPQFDLRILGGQNSINQIDRVAITRNFNINDRVHIIINGNQYTHVVNETFFNSGIAESNLSIATNLAQIINAALTPNDVPVTAAAAGPADIFLTADVAGVPFTVSFPTPPVDTFNTGTISNTNVVVNQPLNYNYQWNGPNGYNNTNLSIYGLEAGDYTFEVTLNGCTSGIASFTIIEPDTLTISTTACNGAFSANVDGGIQPYTLSLYDSNSVLIDQVISNSGKTYTGLTPGANYRLEVLDSSCAVMEQVTIQMPFGLQYDNSKTRVVHDYCNETGSTSGTTEIGGGSIELNDGGLAFSGGSNQFVYTWSGPNGYTNSSMNISGLEPGVYQVTVTDIIFGCFETEQYTVNGAPQLTIGDNGSTTPPPDPNDPSSVADVKIKMTCPGDTATLSVQANGGIINSYTYTWYRNGTIIPGNGTQNTLTTTRTGIYTVTAGINFVDPNLVPFNLNGVNEMRCVVSTSFEVVAATEMSISEINNRRVIPACSNDLAELVFVVNGGNDNAGPYTVSLQGGALSGTSASAGAREVIITGIDPNNINQISTYTVQDASGCSFSGNLAVPITLPTYDDVNFQASGVDIDCSQSQDGGIEFALTSSTPVNTSSYGIQVTSNAPSFNYFTNWDSAPTQNGNPFIPITQPGSYNFTIIGNPVSGSTTNTSVCNLASGTIEISEAENSLILVRDIVTTQPGCGQEYGSIEIVLDEATIPPTMSISWEKVVTQTISTTSGTINTQEWTRIPSLDNQLIAPNLENGTYRAIIDPGTPPGSCSGSGVIVSRSLAVGSNIGIEILNPRYVAKSQSPFPCDDPTQLTYDLLFRVQNNIPNFSGDFNITVNKTSSFGLPYSQTFQAGAPVNANLISKPLTSDKSGNYTIKNVPFGEFEILISESGSVTNTASCDANQTIIIPEIAPLEYTGDLLYEIDPCDREVVIEATVQGGQPFVSPNGDTFYRYQWILTTNNNEIFNYSGQTIIVRDAGSLQLTVYDSTGCEFTVVDQTSPIEVNEGISPYRLDPRLNNNTEFAEEPSCDNPLRDNGKINFEVIGGDLPQGGQYPYEITWEKFDVGTNSYLEMNGTSGLPNLANQEFANNLVPGQYKISVIPINWSCSGQSPFDTVAVSEFITVPQNDDLVITNGPVIDVSEYDFIDPNQLTICEPGGAGNLYVKVFNNYEGDLYFYYPTEANLVTAEQIDNDSYRIQISSSEAVGDLTVVNQEGCRITETINLQIGTPNYTYTSQNAQISGNATQTQMPLILAREEVTFNNTSSGTFSYVEWDFGDGSPIERYTPLTGSSSPVTNIYGVSGTYYPKLRLYNSVGCYEEEVKTLVVGKGYNVMVPNVFTPNGDTYNDRFKPLFSGFQSIQMTVYDYRGNMLYTEESSVDPANPLQPLALSGWDGEIRTESPYYIYAINGTTMFGAIEVLKSGTFIIIR